MCISLTSLSCLGVSRSTDLPIRETTDNREYTDRLDDVRHNWKTVVERWKKRQQKKKDHGKNPQKYSNYGRTSAVESDYE